MSGVAVLRYLLANAAAVVAVVPATRIQAGEIKINTTLPAIAINKISRVKAFRGVRSGETPKFYRERVQVDVLFKGSAGSPSGTGYPGVQALLRLIETACASQRATIAGVAVDSISYEGDGPDFDDAEAEIKVGSCDFEVAYSL